MLNHIIRFFRKLFARKTAAPPKPQSYYPPGADPDNE